MMLSCISGATRIISKVTYTPENFTILCQKYKPTYSVLAPRQVASLNNSNPNPKAFDSLRLMSIGGEAIEFVQLKKIKELIPQADFMVSYGMTEFGSAIATNVGLEKQNSVGKVLPNTKVRIVNSAGENLGPNQEGEIWVWNGRPWKGYYGKPEESALVRDEEGWVHTGDIGHMDEDQYLFISGRKKEILKYHGMHYWPGEIQNVIAELPDVVDVMVTGVYSEGNGDAAGAVIIKKPNSSLSEQDVIEYVEKRMAFYQHLHAGVRFVEKLPKTPNDKSLKRDLSLLFDSEVVKG